MENYFTFGKVAVGLFTHRGTVMAVQGDSRVEYSERGSTLANRNYLHRELKEETNFFFKIDEGKKFSVSLPDPTPLRESHRVTVVYGRCSDGESGSVIGICNETTDKLYNLPLKNVLNRLGYKFPGQPMTAFSGCMAIIVAIAVAAKSALHS